MAGGWGGYAGAWLPPRSAREAASHSPGVGSGETDCRPLGAPFSGVNLVLNLEPVKCLLNYIREKVINVLGL